MTFVPDPSLARAQVDASCPGAPEPEEPCHCGRRLHYSSVATKEAVMQLVATYGPTVPVTTPDGTFIVPRHYIALHGITGANVSELGFPRKDTRMRTYHEDGTQPDPNDADTIFVFGSNLAGIHGAGGAWVARQQYGAILGAGVGRCGSSYAIPTKDRSFQVMAVADIQPYVNEFISYVFKHPELTFFVTGVGCGLAGYKPADIAPLFLEAPENCSFPDTWKDHLEPASGE